MSLGLHDECAKRLSEVIGRTLGNVTVQHRMFLGPNTKWDLLTADRVVPQGKLREALSEYISDIPLADFVVEFLLQELRDTQIYDSENLSSKLSELAEYQDLKALAHRLVAEFESLPWEYTLTIPLPSEIGEFFGRTVKSFALSDIMHIVTPDEGFSSEYPLASGIEARNRDISSDPSLLFNVPPQWFQKVAHLQIQVKGFIGMYGTTTPMENAVALIKAFCGIGIALRLFNTNRTYRPIPSNAKFFVHRRSSEKWVVERTYGLDSPQSDAYNDLVFHDIDGLFATDSVKEAWARENLAKIATVFSMQERSRRITLAGQWLFDSFCGYDELLSFVQTMVVMEILLGDKAVSDLMGLGELLRNRCAYLISTTHQERENILRDFRAIYEVRSNIVHAGKKRLNFKERVLFNKLQWMCRRVIQEEVKLLGQEVAALAIRP